jgi:hypothetical protein
LGSSSKYVSILVEKFVTFIFSAIERYKNDEGFFIEEEKRLPKNLLQRKLWLLLDYPESSFQARIVAIISVLVITISIVIFCIETVPVFDITDEENANTLHDPFFLVETTCICWFACELVMRFRKNKHIN